ncbi:MAG: hypothetical protein VX589_06140 [Myxococcota bacterium]|nr:hypothetical protein [Myxococcota bacterium]
MVQRLGMFVGTLGLVGMVACTPESESNQSRMTNGGSSTSSSATAGRPAAPAPSTSQRAGQMSPMAGQPAVNRPVGGNRGGDGGDRGDSGGNRSNGGGNQAMAQTAIDRAGETADSIGGRPQSPSGAPVEETNPLPQTMAPAAGQPLAGGHEANPEITEDGLSAGQPMAGQTAGTATHERMPLAAGHAGRMASDGSSDGGRPIGEDEVDMAAGTTTPEHIPPAAGHAGRMASAGSNDGGSAIGEDDDMPVGQFMGGSAGGTRSSDEIPIAGVYQSAGGEGHGSPMGGTGGEPTPGGQAMSGHGGQPSTGGHMDEPQCDDRRQNGMETDTDCGGGCPQCPVNSRCRGDGDCSSGRCVGDVCRQTCNGHAACGVSEVCICAQGWGRDFDPCDAYTSADAVCLPCTRFAGPYCSWEDQPETGTTHQSLCDFPGGAPNGYLLRGVCPDQCDIDRPCPGACDRCSQGRCISMRDEDGLCDF